MLNHLASHVMSTNILKAFPGKLNIKRHSPSILYIQSLLYLSDFAAFHLGLHSLYFSVLMTVIVRPKTHTHCYSLRSGFLDYLRFDSTILEYHDLTIPNDIK